MRMDIASPAELMRLEQARFGDGRRQAYLTLLNEHEDTITALSGHIQLLDESGHKIDRRPVSFTGLSGKPGERFTCHLALDGYPEFDHAELSIEAAEFVYADKWAAHDVRMMECAPPELENGPLRVALVAVAGLDAICFPERHGTHWICVCGRFNRWRWTECRRCKRPRDKLLEMITPERVVSDYKAQLESFRVEDQERLKQRAEESRMRKEQARAIVAGKAKEKTLERKLVVVAISLFVVVLAAFGVTRLFNNNDAGSMTTSGSAAQRAPIVDYLDPL